MRLDAPYAYMPPPKKKYRTSRGLPPPLTPIHFPRPLPCPCRASPSGLTPRKDLPRPPPPTPPPHPLHPPESPPLPVPRLFPLPPSHPHSGPDHRAAAVCSRCNANDPRAAGAALTPPPHPPTHPPAGRIDGPGRPASDRCARGRLRAIARGSSLLWRSRRTVARTLHAPHICVTARTTHPRARARDRAPSLLWQRQWDGEWLPRGLCGGGAAGVHFALARPAAAAAPQKISAGAAKWKRSARPRPAPLQGRDTLSTH
jgi:hypothetical protein